MNKEEEKQRAFENYCGAAQTLDSCLRYGEFISGSKDYQEMKAECKILWIKYQRLT